MLRVNKILKVETSFDKSLINTSWIEKIDIPIRMQIIDNKLLSNLFISI